MIEVVCVVLALAIVAINVAGLVFVWQTRPRRARHARPWPVVRPWPWPPALVDTEQPQVRRAVRSDVDDKHVVQGHGQSVAAPGGEGTDSEGSSRG